MTKSDFKTHRIFNLRNNSDPLEKIHVGHRTILKLPSNTKGRDFIVGDLHGMRELLLERLEQVHFDPTQDRVICTGDLVDRGPDSLGTLRLLKEDWFFSTLGNHERILLAFLKQRESRVMYGYAKLYGKWVIELSKSERTELDEMVSLIHQMPLVIQVDHSTLPFFVVHASRISKGKIIKDTELEGVVKNSTANIVGAFTWSRRMALQAIHAWLGRNTRRCNQNVIASKNPWEQGTSLTYVGHTVVPAAILHRSHLFLDRGSCFVKPGLPNKRWDLLLFEHPDHLDFESK